MSAAVDFALSRARDHRGCTSAVAARFPEEGTCPEETVSAPIGQILRSHQRMALSSKIKPLHRNFRGSALILRRCARRHSVEKRIHPVKDEWIASDDPDEEY